MHTDARVLANITICDDGAFFHFPFFVDQMSEPKFAVTMQSDGSVILDGKFVPAAVVTVISDRKLTSDSMLELRKFCVCM